MATSERPLRADARRNRERILRAARVAFAEQGRDAQMDDIARRAEVGVGTLYRHFPTKEALLVSMAIERFESIAQLAEAALDVQDPWEAFAGLLRGAAELQERDLSVREILEHPGVFEASAEARARVNAMTGELIRRAQAAGVLRDDMTAGDIPTLMCSLSAAQRMPCDVGTGWRRLFELVLDGMRPR